MYIRTFGNKRKVHVVIFPFNWLSPNFRLNLKWTLHVALCKSKSNVINSLAFEWDEICVFRECGDERKGEKEREQKTNRYVGQNDGKMVTETHRVSVHTTHNPESTTDEMRREIIKKIRYCSIARSERRPKWNREKKLNQFNLVVAFSIVVNLFTIKWNFSIRSPYLSIFASKTIQNPTLRSFCNFNNFENVIFRFPNCFFSFFVFFYHCLADSWTHNFEWIASGMATEDDDDGWSIKVATKCKIKWTQCHF